MSEQVRTVGEHVRETARKEIRYREKKRIETAIRAVHDRLYRGAYSDAAEALHRRVAVPMGLSSKKVAQLVDALDENDFAYDYLATTHFLENPQAYAAFFKQVRRNDVDTASAAKAAGLSTSLETARKRLRNAFLTIENIAIEQGLIRSELTNAAALEGYALQIGVVWKTFDRELPDTIKLWGITDDEDVTATAIQGKPGSGKSASVDTLEEDRYAAGHKVIDCLDWLECENIFHDVPNQRENLLERRDEIDLPTWWDELDDVDEPTVEVLMPLTPELAEWRVPYDTEDERFVVTPFTIPASEIEKRAFKAMLTHTTDVGSSVLERAFKEVNEIDDWTIADLAKCVRREADDAQVADRVVTELETLQKSSFIRDAKDEHAIDWERIFKSTDVITCFSVAGMSDPASKYMVMLYIIRSLMEERETTTANMGETANLPRLTAAFREMRITCPPASKKTKDPRIRALEGALLDAWRDFSTLHRHNDVEIIGDSQQFNKQVNSDVRANFGRGITFKNKKPHVKAFWKSYGADLDDQYIRRVATQFSPGDFAYLGESNVDERTFHSPCYMAPAMCHHIDTKEEDHGFIARCDYLEHNELRPAPWSAELPDRLAVDQASSSSEPDPDEEPVGFFAYHCLDVDDVGRDEWERTDEVYEIYNMFARREGLPEKTKRSFGIGLSKYLDDDEYEKKEKMVDGERFTAYFGVRINRTGRNVRDDANVEGVIAD
jgi:hypothetical protein